MARIQAALLSYLYDVPDNTSLWLIGRDTEAVLNAVACNEAFDDSHIRPLLPGGLFITGIFLACELPADMAELSAKVKLPKCLILLRSQKVCKAYCVASDGAEQVDLRVEDTMTYSLLHSKTSLVLSSLDSLELFERVNKTVTFEVNGQFIPLSEPTALDWASLVKKPGKPKSVNLEAGIWYSATVPYGEVYNAPSLTVSRASSLYDLQINWVTMFLLTDSLSDVLETHLYKLKEIADYMIEQLRNKPDMQMTCLAFHNQYCMHPFHGVYFLNSEAYTSGDSSEFLKSQRKSLHELFRLPMDWPLVRLSSALVLRPDTDTRLSNVHESLLSPTLSDLGVKYVLKGNYLYYHYSQDSFDDRGWGCAYRSLQTIWSWFREQHYTHKEVPSHYLIQKMLVDAEDKPREFLGSKDWIGSFEISLCLDMHLGVQSKIMSVKSGSELGEKGRELANHFVDQGTPVMIGGGVLAYTLLGVDYDEVSGATRFLILDPHYTGADTLKSVLDKGFCAWKTVELFKKDAFYNLCLPQRPAYF